MGNKRFLSMLCVLAGMGTLISFAGCQGAQKSVVPEQSSIPVTQATVAPTQTATQWQDSGNAEEGVDLSQDTDPTEESYAEDTDPVTEETIISEETEESVFSDELEGTAPEELVTGEDPELSETEAVLTDGTN